TEDRDQRINSENREKEQNKRMQRQIRDIKEEMNELSKKETEASRKKHELQMDIESLEAANQSLQADMKLAFKRIGDLQAAMEDEMETDDDEDLISSLQDMVTKYQKRNNKTGDDSDMDSEVEDRVDGIKSLLSKSKGSTKTVLDEGSQKTRHPNAANADAKDIKEGKEGKEELKKDSDESRSVSVMSSLSYRKRSHQKDWNGGAGDENSLFSALREQSDVPDRLSLRKARSKSTDKPQADDDIDDRGSVISQAYSEASNKARKGLDRRWTKSSPEFDKESMVSSLAPSRVSIRRGLDPDEDARSGVSGFSLRRSTSWMDDSRSEYSTGLSQRSRSRSPGNTSVSSRISLARSTRLSEFGVCDDEDDDDDVDSVSVAAYSPHSLGRSLSTPAKLQSSENKPDTSDIKPVSHRNYLDPDLEKAINEVLSFKPIKFKRHNLEDSDEEEAGAGEDQDKKSLLQDKDDENLSRAGSSLRRSASDSIRCSSSLSSFSSKSSKKKNKKSRRSESDSSSSEGRSRRRSKQKRSKSSKKRESRSSESESESSSSSASTVSHRSSNSVKRMPAQKASDGDPDSAEERPPSKKEVKKQKKKVDSLVMKYLYKPDSD
ncbi:putative unconventional myosin-XVIIIa, partial [Triplophysa rosa]